MIRLSFSLRSSRRRQNDFDPRSCFGNIRLL